MPTPSLRKLNDDSSWLLTTPSGKRIVIDAWLEGSDVADSWSNWMSYVHIDWHATEPAVASLADIEYDAIICTLHFDDHCHKATLLKAKPDTPIFGTPEAVKMIRSWNHFTDVRSFPWLKPQALQGDWSQLAGAVFDDFRVFNIESDKDIASVHFANVMAFRSTPNATHWDFILYTPHGIESHSKSVAALSTLQPPLKAFILMHGTNVVNFPWYLAGIANRGVQNGHELSQILKPRYWVTTHDEDKPRKGLTGLTQVTIKKVFGDLPGFEEMEAKTGVRCRVVGNGETLVLDA